MFPRGFPDALQPDIGYIIGPPAGVSDEASCSPRGVIPTRNRADDATEVREANEIPSSEA